MSLEELKVLVTRPIGQADGLIQAIEKAAGIAYHYPVLAIKPLDSIQGSEYIQACKHLVMDLDKFQKVIFVSTNAVRFGMEWIHNYWPQLPIAIEWFAIGKRSAQALEATGVMVNNIEPDTAMNSEALLQHPALQQIEGENILLVRGVNGREHLKMQLTQRGATVNYLECYHRTLPDQNSENLQHLLTTSIDVICVNSGDSLDNLCTLAGNVRSVLINKRLLVPSQRVADLAVLHGFKQLTVVDNASDKAMLRGLLTLTSMDK